MENGKNKLTIGFVGLWILFTSIGLLIGEIAGFALSYSVVNLFIHHNTNLILGLCLGAVVGYSQWFLLKKKFPISSFWGLACAIGVGLPFIVVSIAEETGIKMPAFFNNDIIYWINYNFLSAGIFGGLLSGLLQIHLLKPFTNRAGWWLLASSIGWGLCFLLVRVVKDRFLITMVASAILLGVVTGFSLLWIKPHASTANPAS